LREGGGMTKTASNRARGGLLALAGLGLAAAFLPGHPAQACGGFFCNQPQNPFDPPPVAQTAENVLFAMEKDPQGNTHLEAHVQIFYTGPADRFSWVVPVDNEPTLDVGTNQLFKVLDPATQPTFGLDWHDEGTCKVDPLPPQAGDSVRAPGTGGSGGSFGADAGASAGVQVSFRGDIGPYDAAVLRSTDPNDPKGLKEWLQTNMYFLSEDGSKLIDDYVKEQKWFVAIRLINGHSVNEIQPLVMRFIGPGPCVPLRLTSIAAINDLRINLWVLGSNRVVPENYFEMYINPARIDWFSGGSNYDELVKKAANQAGGNAFVADFVGPATIMSGRIYSGRYDITRLAQAITPPQAMQEITAQGFPRDAALLELLRKHIPEPEQLKSQGVSELQFYNQLTLYWQMNAAIFAPFDSVKFAADVNERLVLPVKKAQDLFDRFPKLTRLNTFVSPEEMNSDPLFTTNSTLPDIPVQRTAKSYFLCGNKQYNRCQAPIRLELPDGQQLFFKPRKWTGPCYGQDTSNIDRADLEEMPALEVAYQRESIGEGAVRFNNRPAINGAIEEHNVAVRARIMADGIDPWGKNIKHGSSLFGCAIAGLPSGAGPLLVLGAALGWVVRRRRPKR
jgi:hypothetical protein